MKFYKVFAMTMPSLNKTTLENSVLRKELVKQVKKFYVQINMELYITSKPNRKQF